MNGNPVPVFGVPFVLGTIARIIAMALAATPMENPHGFGDDAGLITNLIIQCLALTCVMHATVAHGADRKAGLAACLNVSGKRLLPLLAVLVCYSVAVMLGSLVFLIPGIMLAILWSVAMPVIVEERRGLFGAFGRSQNLTRGARWKLFGLFLLLLLMSLGVFIVVLFLSALVLGETYDEIDVRTKPVAILFSSLHYALQSALWGGFVGAAFVVLRDGKEGSSDGQLSEIFA